MPDHLHVVMSLQAGYNGSLQRWVSAFKSYTAKAAKIEFGIQRLWQMNFYEHVISRDESLLDIVGYVLHNPVRKGIVTRWEDYPHTRMLASLPL